MQIVLATFPLLADDRFLPEVRERLARAYQDLQTEE
jgi:hypothetical protein